MKGLFRKEAGSTLVVTVAVVALLLVLLGVAVDYSGQISRNTERTRKTALAMEIADGHLETLFTNWRNIYRTTWIASVIQNGFNPNTGGTDNAVLATNYFATTMYTPFPAAAPLLFMNPHATPPVIPLPAPSNFPSAQNYTVTQYRIQAIDPMVNLDAAGNALYESGSKGGGNLVPLPVNILPPAAYGPNSVNLGLLIYGYPYSYYYLASVDVQVPAMNGTVTAKVRRVFEKKFDLPWRYAIFYVDDLELQPDSPFTINGPIHTNSSLFIGTNNFSIASPTTAFPTSGPAEYGSDYVNGFAPGDPRSSDGTVATVPNFAKSDPLLTLSDCPPSQVSPYMPFGWNLTLSATNGNSNDDSYREIVEPPVGAGNDNLQSVRYYNQAKIKIIIDKDNVVTIKRPGDPLDPRNPAKDVLCTSTSPLGSQELAIYNLISGSTKALTTNLALKDAKENVNVRIAELDISKIAYALNNPLVSGVSGFNAQNAVIYIGDTTPVYDPSGARNVVSSPQARLGSTDGVTGGNAVNTSERAIRLVNGWALPNTGLTIATPNPIYIKGNYNTGGTSVATSSPPSNTTTTSAPVVGTYTRKPSAIICDAINVLSSNWTDTASTGSISGRNASSTTVNTAIVTGNIKSGNGNAYGGGAEGLIRLQEDWRTQNFVYYGAIVQLYQSVQATSASAGGGIFKSPAATRWFYDYDTFSDTSPPGDMVMAAYLQQQRWFQVY